MTRWSDFARARPDLATAGRALLYQHGVGLAFLSTVRADGGPRVHPVCPILSGEGAYAFIIPSPKQTDLRRDQRYAMHSFPCPDNEDAIYLTGRVRMIDDDATRLRLAEQFVEERMEFNLPPPSDDDALVEFDIDRCLLTTTVGHGDPHPIHVVWEAEADIP